MGITHVHSSIIHKTQEVETTQVSVDGEWINKMWHMMEYYSVLKRKEIPSHVKTWMNIEDLMLGELSQSQKCTYTSNRNNENKKESLNIPF